MPDYLAGFANAIKPAMTNKETTSRNTTTTTSLVFVSTDGMVTGEARTRHIGLREDGFGSRWRIVLMMN